jgi:hypothetical protein
MENRHPIAFKSRKLREQEKLYPIYDNKMLAIMHVLAKFRQYLVGGRFVVRTVLHVKFPHLHNVLHMEKTSCYKCHKCCMWHKHHILSATSVVSVTPKFFQVS